MTLLIIAKSPSTVTRSWRRRSAGRRIRDASPYTMVAMSPPIGPGRVGREGTGASSSATSAPHVAEEQHRPRGEHDRAARGRPRQTGIVTEEGVERHREQE